MGFSKKGFGKSYGYKKHEPDPVKVGKYLKSLRKDMNMSLRDVQNSEAEISNAYLSQIERGDRGVPNFSILKRLSRVYGIEFWELARNIDYLTPDIKSIFKPSSPDVEFMVKGFRNLSDEGMIALKKYLLFLLNEDKKAEKVEL